MFETQRGRRKRKRGLNAGGHGNHSFKQLFSSIRFFLPDSARNSPLDCSDKRLPFCLCLWGCACGMPHIQQTFPREGFNWLEKEINRYRPPPPYLKLCHLNCSFWLWVGRRPSSSLLAKAESNDELNPRNGIMRC